MKNYKGGESILIFLFVVIIVVGVLQYLFNYLGIGQTANAPANSSQTETGTSSATDNGIRHASTAAAPSNIANWGQYQWNRHSYPYPSTWTISKLMYSTSAGFSQQVGFRILPPNFHAGSEDAIEVGGNHFDCRTFLSQFPQGLCADIFTTGASPVHTLSKNQEIISVYKYVIGNIK